MNFNIKGNTEEQPLVELAPAIYKEWSLIKTESTVAVKGNGETGKDILVFTLFGSFTDTDGKIIKTKYSITEWANEEEKKLNNQMKRIAHIQRKYLTQEQTEEVNTLFDKGEIKTWKDYANWAASTLPSELTKVVKVDFKVIGSVYSGKRKSGIPGYIPFMFKSGTTAMSFSNSELKGNGDWFNFKPVSANSSLDDLDMGAEFSEEDPASDLPF